MIATLAPAALAARTPEVDPAAGQTLPSADLESLFDLLLAGGPLMVPIVLCSVLALGLTVERWMRLRPGFLGSARFGHSVVAAVQDKGAQAALELCNSNRSPLSRVLAAGLARAEAPFLEREKVVEDTASGELARLSARLRPLYVVFLVAPLLGLLGTVWGMIQAFSNIAAGDGLGKPEVLAAGIYQALTTTAAGLAVAIPALVAYYVLRGQVERFGARTETIYREVDLAVRNVGA